jgi:hypothetical protein
VAARKASEQNSAHLSTASNKPPKKNISTKMQQNPKLSGKEPSNLQQWIWQSLPLSAFI